MLNLSPRIYFKHTEKFGPKNQRKLQLSVSVKVFPGPSVHQLPFRLPPRRTVMEMSRLKQALFEVRQTQQMIPSKNHEREAFAVCGDQLKILIFCIF